MTAALVWGSEQWNDLTASEGVEGSVAVTAAPDGLQAGQRGGGAEWKLGQGAGWGSGAPLLYEARRGGGRGYGSPPGARYEQRAPSNQGLWAGPDCFLAPGGFMSRLNPIHDRLLTTQTRGRLGAGRRVCRAADGR